MALIDFPNSPVVGDLHGSLGTVWRWDGARWASTSAASSGTRGVVAMGSFVVNGAMALTALTYNNVTNSLSAFTQLGRRYRVTFVARAISPPATAGICRVSLLVNGSGLLGTTTPLHWMPVNPAYTMMNYSWIINGSGTTRTFLVQLNPDYAVSVYGEPELSSFYIEDITFEQLTPAAMPPAPIVVWTTAQTSVANAFASPVILTAALNSPSITPLSTNSKFLVRVSLMIGQTGADDAAFWLYRGASQVGNGAGATTVNCARYHRFAAATQSNLEMAHITWEYLDSPNTVTPFNYCPAMAVRVGGGTQTLYLNRRGDSTAYAGTSSMVIQEIP